VILEGLRKNKPTVILGKNKPTVILGKNKLTVILGKNKLTVILGKNKPTVILGLDPGIQSEKISQREIQNLLSFPRRREPRKLLNGSPGQARG
jgi:hypothetical protein